VAEKHHANCFLSCQDVGVTSRSVASMVRYLQGDEALAMDASADSVALAESLKHPFSQAYALGCAAWLHSYRRDLPSVSTRAQDTMVLSQAQALGWWLLWGMVFAGRGMAAAGNVDEGIAQMETALGMYRGVGTGMVVPYFLAQLAEAYSLRGDYQSALDKLEDARRQVAAGGEAIASAEIDRLEGEIRIKAGQSAESAQPFFDRALATAREQGAKLFEQRILDAMSLAR
jgi:predicted ATPase